MNYNEVSFTGFLSLLSSHLDKNGDDIISSLERASQKGFKFPETITPEEERHAKAIIQWLLEVGPKNKRTVARIAVLLMSYIFYDDFHYPQPETGAYDIANNNFEKLKWVYRYWFNQLEIAEKGAGIEDAFASQDLRIFAIKTPEGLDNVKISCAGDLLAVDVLVPDNTPHLFDKIVDFYSSADIVSANLESTVDQESPVGRTQAPGQPARMNTSEKMFQKFRSEAKINFFSTATNHAMDWGEQGVLATLEVLKRSKAMYSGTAKNEDERDKVVIFEKDGIRVAMLSFTMDLNGYNTPPGKSYLVNEVRFNDVDPATDYSLIKKQVKAAKDAGADWIIAYCHWGWEFEMYPHVNIRQAARDIIACGVDTILGNHAHVSQPAEVVLRGGLKQPALVIYSYGDFVSYHPESRNSKISYITKFDIVKSKTPLPDYPTLDTCILSNLEVMPIYILNELLADGRYNSRVLKFYDVLDNPDAYGLTELEKSQLPHLRDKVWKQILSPLSKLNPIN